MYLLLAAMVLVCLVSLWIERRELRRREYAILEGQQRFNEVVLAEQMDAAGFELVELHVNERGCRLRDNAEWN